MSSKKQIALCCNDGGNCRASNNLLYLQRDCDDCANGRMNNSGGGMVMFPGCGQGTAQTHKSRQHTKPHAQKNDYAHWEHVFLHEAQGSGLVLLDQKPNGIRDGRHQFLFIDHPVVDGQGFLLVVHVRAQLGLKRKRHAPNNTTPQARHTATQMRHRRHHQSPTSKSKPGAVRVNAHTSAIMPQASTHASNVPPPSAPAGGTRCWSSPRQ